MLPIPFGLTQLRAGIYTGIALVFILVLGFAGCEHKRANLEEQRADLERSKRKNAESQRDQVIAVNAANMETIGKLQAAIDEWAKLGVSPKDVIEMIAIANDALRLARQEMAAADRAKEKDRANPDCAALLRVDFQRACPLAAGELRKHESRYQDRDGVREGPGVRAVAAGAAGTALSALPLPAGQDQR